MNLQSMIEDGFNGRNKLEVLRFGLNLNQGDFGKMLGISKQLVHLYETNKTIPTLKNWIKIKESALNNGIELSDDIYQDFLEAKARSMMDDIKIKMEQLRILGGRKQ